VDDLVQRLGVAYTRYADIRRFVIQPAVKELKDKSDMEIDWTPIKDGQKVTAIRFEFREQSQRKLDFDAPPTQATACGGGKRRLRRKP
jgi:plasmid replication initiation protein